MAITELMDHTFRTLYNSGDFTPTKKSLSSVPYVGGRSLKKTFKNATNIPNKKSHSIWSGFFVLYFFSRITFFAGNISHINYITAVSCIVPLIGFFHLLHTAATWIMELPCIGINDTMTFMAKPPSFYQSIRFFMFFASLGL